ncbi:MAG: aldo/keto reductase [Flavobacteriaceae bacterium]|nr:aldo/keto reductase [Flavobacteriaceae bacterium]
MISKKILNTGDEIPVIGLGTFGSDTYSNGEVAQAVKFAIENGYSHIDCASVYGNEKVAIQELGLQPILLIFCKLVPPHDN